MLPEHPISAALAGSKITSFPFACQVVLEFAVGTSVAGRPPHRSVHEELLHTAPTSGSSRKAFGSASRILSSPFNAYSCLCVQVADNCPEFPLGHRPFLRNLRHDMENMPLCSAPSSVLRRCQTAQQRPCKDYGHGPSLTVPPSNTAEAAELSRFSNIERLRMLRVSDSAGPVNDWLYNAAARGAFPNRSTWSAPRKSDFGAQWLAYASPINVSRAVSRPPAHDSGP